MYKQKFWFYFSFDTYWIRKKLCPSFHRAQIAVRRNFQQVQWREWHWKWGGLDETAGLKFKTRTYFCVKFLCLIKGFAGESERSDGSRVVGGAAGAPVRVAGPRAPVGAVDDGLPYLLRRVRHRGTRAGRPVGTAARRGERPQAPGGGGGFPTAAGQVAQNQQRWLGFGQIAQRHQKCVTFIWQNSFSRVPFFKQYNF